jgi:hypothetical protein
MFIAEYQAPVHFEATPSQVITAQEVSNPNYFSNIKESYLQSKSKIVESKSQPKLQVKSENGQKLVLNQEVSNRLQELKANSQSKANKSTVNLNEGYKTIPSSKMGEQLDRMNGGVEVAQFWPFDPINVEARGRRAPTPKIPKPSNNGGNGIFGNFVDGVDLTCNFINCNIGNNNPQETQPQQYLTNFKTLNAPKILYR